MSIFDIICNKLWTLYYYQQVINVHRNNKCHKKSFVASCCLKCFKIIFIMPEELEAIQMGFFIMQIRETSFQQKFARLLGLYFD